MSSWGTGRPDCVRVGDSDADLGRSCTEGRRPPGGLDQQSERLPAEGAAASEIWPTVCGQFVIFIGKSEIYIFGKPAVIYFFICCQLSKKNKTTPRVKKM